MNNWNSLSDFIYMNGHGYFVWCAYGALLVAVIYEIFSPVSYTHLTLPTNSRV